MAEIIKRPILVFGRNLTKKWFEDIKGNKIRCNLTDLIMGKGIEIGLRLSNLGEVEHWSKYASENKTIKEETEEKTVKNSCYTIQFNRLRNLRLIRIPECLGKQEDLPIHGKECKFCYSDGRQQKSLAERDVLHEVLLNDQTWQFYRNDFPFDRNGHFILVPNINDAAQRRQQILVSKDVQDMIYLIRNSESLLITFNSLHAGASINHIHFQGIYHGTPLPIEKKEVTPIRKARETSISILKDYPAHILVIESVESSSLAEATFNFVNLLQDKGIPFNILFEKNKVYIIPRNINAEVVEEFPKGVLAAVDIGGRLIAADRMSYTKVTNKRIERAFRKTTLSLLEIDNLVREIFPVYVIGISVSGAGFSSVALIKNGKLELAIEEERISRRKYDQTVWFPYLALDRVLKEKNIVLTQVDEIAVSWNVNLFCDTEENISSAKQHLSDYKNQYKDLGKEAINWINRRITFYSTADRDVTLNLSRKYNISRREISQRMRYIRHHLAHAANAYYASGFTEPTIVIVIDGSGELESTTVWKGEGKEIDLIESFIFPDSLGWFYSSVTEYLGFRPHAEEGQVMGLAPYGRPNESDFLEMERVKKIREIMMEFLNLNDDGTYKLNSRFLWCGKNKHGMRLTDEFVDKMRQYVPQRTKGAEITRAHQNLAYVLEDCLEKAVLNLVGRYVNIHPKTKGIRNLALGGGVALNILVNRKIQNSGIVKNFFVVPTANDVGASLGAALICWKNCGGSPFSNLKHVYYGTEYTNKEIEKVLLKSNLSYHFYDDDRLVNCAAELIARGIPVAWFQGKMELGPRALGNRSIFLSLTDIKNNALANVIKGRELWRPSAMSITRERCFKYLKMGKIKDAPFMIIGFDVHDKYRNKIASGLHPADHITRPQTVSSESNFLFWKLLNNIEKLTGIAGVLNTSFNYQGEPIVESPKDAILTFKNMPVINYLAIGNFIVQKKTIN